MIWFNIKKLEAKLKKGQITDRYTLNYLFAISIFISTFPWLLVNDYSTKCVIVIEILITIIITIIGTKITFDINSKGDNIDYYKRYLSLSFVISVRLTAFIFFGFMISLIILYFIAVGIGIDLESELDSNPNLNDFITLAFTTAYPVIFYFNLTRSFKRVSQ